MANSYTQFSESLDVETDEQKAWLDDWLAVPTALLVSGNEEALLKWAKKRGTDAGDAEYWPNFEYRWSGEKNYKDESVAPWSLWVYSEESGNVENVADTVLAFFRKFKLDKTFTLTWSEACSSMRVGEFSGGGFIVMPLGRKVRWSTPYMLFDRVRKQQNRRKSHAESESGSEEHQSNKAKEGDEEGAEEEGAE
jgi:hypothetical protein